jgi:hypothetical protein
VCGRYLGDVLRALSFLLARVFMIRLGLDSVYTSSASVLGAGRLYIV